MGETDRAIKAFLKPRMYSHSRVMHVMTQADQIVRDLFSAYVNEPQELPPERLHSGSGREHPRVRQIGNFIAGMTDRFALVEHKRIFDSTPELR
jgi:dGTPase